MAFKQTFLQLPLNVQIYLSLILITFITLALIIALSQVFTVVHSDYIVSTKKVYFYNMQQSIIESNLLFLNLCILQYESLIKLFNYQIYLYLKDERILIKFTKNNTNDIFSNDIKICKVEDPNKDNKDNILIPEQEQILYIYSYSIKSILGNNSIINLIYSNYLSFLNQIKAVRNFRIPYYGNLTIMGEYIMSFTNYNIFFSLNNSRIKDVYNYFEGNMGRFLDFITSREETNYHYFKKYFDLYENNELLFMDILYNLKYNIFSNYKEINDKYIKEDYIRNQSIFFQNIYFENDSTWFYDNWNPKITRFQGANNIMTNFIDFLLFQLSSKIDAYSIPFSHDTNKIISKNICYFFLLKQIIYLNITSDKDDYFDRTFLDNIYNEIFNKKIIDISDCKLEKYYSKIKGPMMNIDKNFTEYYDLKYIFDYYIYLLRNNDLNSIIFGNKFSYPNFMTLKDISPDFFLFQQLDFYSYTFGDEITKMISTSKRLYINMRYLMILCLLVNWIIFLFAFGVFLSRTIIEVTEPIIRLTEIIDLNNLNEKNINENIFEYKSDDEINEFFLLCKKLIDGEMKDSNFKNKENSEINNNINNNMIINNKMILELIESQKSLNKDDKEIFLLKQAYANDTRNKKHRTNKSSKLFNKDKDKNSQGVHFNLIKVTSSKDNENKLVNSNEDIYSDIDENEHENSNRKFYDDLLDLADYVYNGKDKDKDKEKNNIMDKLRININHASITNPSLVRLASASNISLNNKIENDKNFRKDCKYITYFWYADAKKNKKFGTD